MVPVQGGVRMQREVFATSKTCEWSTPQYLFNALDLEFHFDLDVCATKDNAKCEKYYTKEQNGLLQSWSGTCWMNPPYGREIGKWMKKAKEESRKGNTVVCLVPARTDTAWWHDHVIAECAETRFLRGRIKFGGSKNGAPFPSAIVIYKAVT